MKITYIFCKTWRIRGLWSCGLSVGFCRNMEPVSPPVSALIAFPLLKAGLIAGRTVWERCVF